ncbi:MAG: molybdenum cofactor biosynthesis protein MoaE [Candidatus Dormibacteria bacterium]
MRVEVLLFARLRDLAGRQAASIVLPEPACARDAWDALVARIPQLAGADSALRVAVDEAYTAWSAPLREGSVVAFLPPVSGGSGAQKVRAWLSAEPLDPPAIEASVAGAADGAVCSFVGLVRGLTEGRRTVRLEYQAYAGMAEEQMHRIGEETVRGYGLSAIVLAHRTGSLEVGEPSVVVAAAAPHRAEAFAGCRHAIDTLKSEVPIWKREWGPDGGEWVESGVAEASEA